MPSTDPFHTKRVARLKTALGKLAPRHFDWICEAAASHFQGAIEEAEDEILRLKAFPSIPITSSTVVEQTDEQQLQQHIEREKEYRLVLEAVYATQDLVRGARDLGFVKAMVEYFNSR